jgi:anti-anti-sigma factor
MSTQSPPFDVRARQVAAAHVVSPSGELDLYSVTGVREALAARPDGCATVVLDLRGLSFFDTTGMRLVLETLQDLDSRGVRFAILRGGPEVERLFALARLEDRLPFFDELDEALAAH